MGRGGNLELRGAEADGKAPRAQAYIRRRARRDFSGAAAVAVAGVPPRAFAVVHVRDGGGDAGRPRSRFGAALTASMSSII